MEETITYKEAIEEIESIISHLENDKPDVDELAKSVKRVSVLIKFCKDKLSKTDSEVGEILETLK